MTVDETEAAMAKMRKGICPVCNRPMTEHTRDARKVCFNLCQERYGIGKKKVIINGKETEVRIRPASLVDD